MRLHFDRGSGDANYHGPKLVPIKGPKLSVVKLSVHPPSVGWRFIFYKRSGGWLYLDIYIDRRSQP